MLVGNTTALTSRFMQHVVSVRIPTHCSMISYGMLGLRDAVNAEERKPATLINSHNIGDHSMSPRCRPMLLCLSPSLS